MSKMSGKTTTITKKKPAIKKSASTGAARRKSASRGLLENTGARLDILMRRALSAAVTYTAVFAVGVVIIAVMMLFAGGYFFNIGGRVAEASKHVARASGFEVVRISLKGGEQISADEVIAALYDRQQGQVLGQSLLHYDAQTARQSIEELGWVEHAAIAKLWPNTLHVSVQERIPAALWQRIGTGELYLIDQHGALITEVGGHQYTGLPMVLNADEPSKVREVLTALAAYPALADRIAGLRQQGKRRWDLVFRNDFVVMLPETGFDDAIKKLANLEAGTGRPSEAGEYLNMRDAKTVYFKPKT